MDVLQASAYVVPGDTLPGGDPTTCITAFMQGGDSFWLMGDPFFRSVYAVLDVDSHTYGMAKNVNSP